jgi:hypothetical protein
MGGFALTTQESAEEAVTKVVVKAAGKKNGTSAVAVESAAAD